MTFTHLWYISPSAAASGVVLGRIYLQRAHTKQQLTASKSSCNNNNQSMERHLQLSKLKNANRLANTNHNNENDKTSKIIKSSNFIHEPIKSNNYQCS